MSQREIDAQSGIETTGHEWDGIKELNNPLPRWWLWTFYATIIFSIGYVIYYPALPLINGSTMGISGETNRSILKQELEVASVERRQNETLVANTDLESIRENDALYRFAVAGGSSLFKVNCSQCHGSGAQGGPGYPNLNDDDWLWGGDLDAIYTSIKHGIRVEEDDDARFSEMPAFGTDGILESAEIAAITEYVLGISNLEHDPALAASGENAFVENCSACHLENGKGDREFGAPNLADAISLYGGTRETIKTQISKPKHGVMPAWGNRLGEANVKQLTLYVHSLGGGEKASSE